MQKRNLIWIVVDGCRPYRAGDDRDRLAMMDTFANRSVEFTNAFTAAPSSILSAAAMFTGLPAPYISRHFNDFVFDPARIDSIQTLLKARGGYNIYSIFDAMACRSALQTMAHGLPRKLLPRSVSQGEWWPNREITKILRHLFEQGHVEEPGFFLLWYNCRRDPETSRYVEEALEIFDANGCFEDAVVVLCSDHGYPDPRHGLSRKVMVDYPHDLIVTDDNIRIPLFLKIPGAPVGSQVTSVVSAADLFPTLLECLSIEPPDRSKMNYAAQYRGQSLMPLIRQEDPGSARIARTDTRLSCASGRIVSLRSDSHKYVRFVDNDTEALFDLSADPLERRNLMESPDAAAAKITEPFRRLLDAMDEAIHLYHQSELTANLTSELRNRFSRSTRRRSCSVLVLATAPASLLKALVGVFGEEFRDVRLDLMTYSGLSDRYRELDVSAFLYVDDFSGASVEAALEGKSAYDTVVLLTENSKYHFVDPQLMAAVKVVRARRRYLMDYNFRVYSRLLSKWIAPILRLYRRNAYYYRQEPTLFLRDLFELVRTGLRVNLLGDRRARYDPERIKIMRDRNADAFGGENPFVDDRAVDATRRARSEDGPLARL